MSSTIFFIRKRGALSYAAACALIAAACALPAQTSSYTPAEARAARALEAAKKRGAPELYAFLKPFPKGADLHMHLSGAIYAETFIAEAVKQGLCIAPVEAVAAPVSLAVPTPQGAVKFAPPISAHNKETCGDKAIPAATALTNQALYDALIDSFSMRAFVPSPGINGHDQFFATFARFGGLKSFAGEWLDEVATRAASQDEQYLEIMQTPPFSNAATLGYKLGWPAGAEKNVTAQQLSDLRTALLALGITQEVAADRKDLDDAEQDRRARELCTDNTPMFKNLAEITQGHSAACTVKIHWLYQILRGNPPQQVFAQTLLGFEVASVDPDVVGLNFVMPEDGRLSMQDYHLQMQMLDYLHSVYPKVHISLHAGEVAPGLVPPEGLKFHIREAVELGHAERIGHGIDILYEDDPAALLKEMAAKHIDVEINLTSNDGILGIKGTEHPLAAYRAAHVPFSLSTDDEGVSRIDLTHEYARAVLEQNLAYADLKQSARDSLEHSFLHGESLYITPDDYTHRKPVCAAAISITHKLSPGCEAFLLANEKASAQLELEYRFALFEATQP